MAALLEQNRDDGTPLSGADRWSMRIPKMREFSLGTILRALFLTGAALGVFFVSKELDKAL